MADAQVIELDPDTTESRRDLAASVRYLELPGATADTFAAAVEIPRSGFAPFERRYIDFGSTPDSLWLSLEVRNASDRDATWRLSFNVRFMTEMLVYQRRADSGEVLLRQTENSTFAERPEPYRLLAVPFSLAAGEANELLVGYRSLGTTALPLSIETDASFAQRHGRSDAINLAAYAAVVFLAVLSLLQALLFNQRSQLSYALYLIATLAYILHMDGWSFQLLWPAWPRWNSYAAIPLGLAMSAAAVLFTRSFVETRAVAVRLDNAMLALVGVAVLLGVSGFVVAESTLKGLAYLLASVAAAACLGAGVLAHVRRRPAMRFFIIGWLGVFAGVVATSVANNFPAVIRPDVASLIPKLTILFDALMFYTALSDRARAWRVQRDRAVRGELEALRAQQQTAEQLHLSEHERLAALGLAKTKSEQLAMASHDIRQPLASLRLTLERLVGSDGAPTATARGVRQSLDYLQKLADEYSADPAEVPAMRAPTPPEQSFSLTTLLHNVDLMFREEAEAKGLTFRCRRSAAVVRGDAMSAMRLVSNLVANAIKYTERGRVLVGCRRVTGAVRIVVADTGLGIEAEERARVLQAGERGTAARETEGHGLGLAIATKLAEQSGYRLDYRSEPGQGTVFFVELPLAR